MFTIDFPCLSAHLDDAVFLPVGEQNFTVVPPPSDATTWESTRTDVDSLPLPLCSIEVETMAFSKTAGTSSSSSLPAGRWVKEPWPNTTVCPQPFSFDNNFTMFQVIAHDGESPHCWHRDDLSVIGGRCYEMNCALVRTFDKFKTTFRDQHWMGVWRRYDCDYYEYTNAQLQQCIDTLQISQFKTAGASIATFLEEYLRQRVGHLFLYNGTAQGRTATLDTLSLLHRTLLTSSEFDEWIHLVPNVTDDPNNYHYVVSGYFLSSERESNAHAEVIFEMNQKLSKVLPSKGYAYLNAYDLSAAMSYETATQFDGMHLIGPTAKMVLTKFFHHLCQSVVVGSRV